MCSKCSIEESKYNHPSTKKEAMMTLQPNKFVRKPFYIDAVQVTAENINDVAEWCQGDIRTHGPAKSAPAGETGQEKYIKVRVNRPLNPRQTQAFVGDWVLYAGTGFKVYTNKAFEGSFEMVAKVWSDDNPNQLPLVDSVGTEN